MAAATNADASAISKTSGVSKLHSGTSPPAKRTRCLSALRTDGAGGNESISGGGARSCGGSLGGKTAPNAMTSVASAGSESLLRNGGNGEGSGAGNDPRPKEAAGSSSGPEGVRKLGRGASEGGGGGTEGEGGGGSAGGGGRDARDGGGGGKPGTPGRFESASEARCIAFNRVWMSVSICVTAGACARSS